ncbi:MAG: hypothetical protein ACXWNK_16370 [Vulcanimicrobiaceae bacterium]
MYYVELLRVLRGMRVVGIILGILLVFAIGLRLVFWQAGSPEKWVSSAERSPTAHITHTRLPDGTNRMVVDDPQERTHIVVDDRGYNGKHVTILEPTSKARHQHEGNHISMGSMSMDESSRNGLSRVEFETNNSTDLGKVFLASLPLALIFATIVGCTLARENDGHLELAWTKPVSREVYALTAIGVDLAGIVATVIGSVIVFIAATALFQLPLLYVNGDAVMNILIALLMPMAWYAMLTAVSASLKRGYGAVIGAAWPVAVILPLFVAAFSSHRESSIAQAVAAILRTIDTLNPLIYVGGLGKTDVGLVPSGLATSVIASFALIIVYVALAVLQWRRVEA